MALDPSIIEAIAPVGVVAVIASMGAWVVTTWMKVKNGYPLENSWGKPMYPNGGGVEKAPLTALTAVMKSKSTDDPVYHWFTKQMQKKNVSLNGMIYQGLI